MGIVEHGFCEVDGWRQIRRDPDSNAVFTFLIHADTFLSMEGLSDVLAKTTVLLLSLTPCQEENLHVQIFIHPLLNMFFAVNIP